MGMDSKFLFAHDNFPDQALPPQRQTLLVRIPGGSGHGWPGNPKYGAETLYFWLHGYPCYLFSAPGQDSNKGVYTPKRARDSLKTCLGSLISECEYNRIFIVATCVGGLPAVHAALSYPNHVGALVLYETALAYTEQTWPKYIGCPGSAEIGQLPNFLSDCSRS